MVTVRGKKGRYSAPSQHKTKRKGNCVALRNMVAGSRRAVRLTYNNGPDSKIKPSRDNSNDNRSAIIRPPAPSSYAPITKSVRRPPPKLGRIGVCYFLDRERRPACCPDLPRPRIPSRPISRSRAPRTRPAALRTRTISQGPGEAVSLIFRGVPIK